MSINIFYTTPFSTKRLKTDQSEYEENLTGKNCHIQQESGEKVELEEGAFYTLYNMWCPILDIQIGDQVITSDGTYQVKEVKAFEIGGNQHLQLLIVK
jgi:hypothetical protein